MTSQYRMLGYIQAGPTCLDLTLKSVEEPAETIAESVKQGQFERIILTGIGSSYTASLISAPLFAWYSPVPVQVVDSWEFTNLPRRLVNEKTLVVAISRSGERGLVIDSLKRAEHDGAYVVAVTGMPGSLITEYARLTIVTQEGPEITYPKTKSVICCAGALMRLALALADRSDAEAKKHVIELRAMPEVLECTLRHTERAVAGLIPAIEKHELIGLMGTGSNYGVALEGALKLQETSNLPTFGASTCDFHGGLVGGVTSKWLVVALVTRQDQNLNLGVLHIARELGAGIACVSEPNLNAAEQCAHCVTLPTSVDSLLSGLVYLVPMQLLTYLLTVAKGKNPDSPASMDIMLKALLPPGREEPELRAKSLSEQSPY